MKIKLLTLIAILGLASCNTVKTNTSEVLDQAKANKTSTFYATKLDNGVEAGGNVSTTVFRVRPYASFKVGVQYIIDSSTPVPAHSGK